MKQKVPHMIKTEVPETIEESRVKQKHGPRYWGLSTLKPTHNSIGHTEKRQTLFEPKR